MDKLLELCVKYGIEISVRFNPTLDTYEIHAHKKIGCDTRHCVCTVSLMDLCMTPGPDYVWGCVYEKICSEFGLF